MRDALSRVAVWGVVDDLVGDVFRATAQVDSGQPLRRLLREATLSLDRCTTLSQAHAKLALIGYLFQSAAMADVITQPLAQQMLARILHTAQTMRRLDDDDAQVDGPWLSAVDG